MEPLVQLDIALPRRGSRSLRVTLHQQLRTAILDGRLKPGVRLPSTRALADHCAVSRNTVVAAYELLLSEGYVATRRGSGTAVAQSLPGAGKPRGSDRRAGAQHRLGRHWQGRSVEAAAAARAPPRFAFQVGVPDYAGFPFDIWRRLSNRVLRRFRAAPALAADPQGSIVLRAAIARHVSFARAVACDPQDIVVTAGAQQAFDLLARILKVRDRSTAALENPGYPPLRAAFAAHGWRIAAVPVDHDGLIVERVPAHARVICVTPSHQFPLGAVLSAPRRTALLESARRRGAVIIEDDYDGEFRYVDRPLDALQTLDRTQSVFYVGTFSKSLLPELRLGYIVAPPWALAALVAAKQAADGQCSPLAQATLALLISEGHLARHVRRMQIVYHRRRGQLLEGLLVGFDGRLEALCSAAGLHVTARLAPSCDEPALIAAAATRGVGVGGLRRYYAGTPAIRGLVLGYGNIEETAIAEGLARLRQAMPAR